MKNYGQDKKLVHNKNNKFRAYSIALICSLMDPLQKKRIDSYHELMVWILMLLYPLEIGIYTNIFCYNMKIVSTH